MIVVDMPWIMNAAWKIVKTWLGPEAVSKLKFTSRSEVQTLIEPDWVPNIINESLLFFLEVQPDISDNSLRTVRNAALITWFFMGILNPMQAFLNTLAFHGWTGLDLDLSTQRRRELAWDSMSTSAPNTGGDGGGGGYNSMVGTTLLYQGHIQEGKKSLTGNGFRPSDSVSVLSEGGSESSPVEINMSSELRDFDDADAEAESLENLLRD
ncbi:hypothetical protein CRUP_013977 [Coryphaenoides rupestris]|nr:hypothetical protein CRUP_013977 [Coryphaenoides rupestris]